MAALFVGLAAVTVLVTSARRDISSAADQVCRQHEMIVNSLIYPPKTPQATAVRCATLGQAGDLRTYIYPLSGAGFAGSLGGFFIPFVCLVFVACAGVTLLVWNRVSSALRR